MSALVAQPPSKGKNDFKQEANDGKMKAYIKTGGKR